MTVQKNVLENLPNKPLVEALFELKWGPDTPEMLGYPIIVGALYEKLKDLYPEIENLPLNRVPPELTSHMVRHRFRKTKEGWPLVQVGPGILTANETEGYTTWDEFYKYIQHVIRKLSEAHPKGKELVAKSFMLRYINANEYPFDKENILPFLESRFKTKIVADEGLFTVGGSTPIPADLLLRLSFPLTKPYGFVTLQFAKGEKLDKQALIWELIVSSSPPQIESLLQGAEQWLEEAHGVIEHWFKRLTEGELLEGFKRKPK